MRNLLFLSIILFVNACQPNQNVNSEVQDDLTEINATPTIDSAMNRIDSTQIVIDLNSNLMWMKHDFSFIRGRFLNDWNEIFEWEAAVNKINYAGFSDWRVPTIKDYRTINGNSSDRMWYKTRFKSLDSTCVWGVGPYSFWSSTTPNKFTASYISFIDGFATSGSRTKQFSNPYSAWKGAELGMSVRLVRNMK